MIGNAFIENMGSAIQGSGRITGDSPPHPILGYPRVLSEARFQQWGLGHSAKGTISMGVAADPGGRPPAYANLL
jgi:hypothetical protein